MPTIYVIAGPNGVGKTTFADYYLPDEAKQLEFVNVDLIARGLSPYEPDAAAMAAGRIGLARIKHLIGEGVGFTWETTMSGRSAVAWLREAKAAGYTLKCYFVWVGNVEYTINRVRSRVTEGGHDIPENTSRRRFLKTIQNFFEIYRPLFDSWKFFENETGRPRLLAVQKNQRMAFRDQSRFLHLIADARISI